MATFIICWKPLQTVWTEIRGQNTIRPDRDWIVKELFKKVDFEIKKNQMTKKHAKFSTCQGGTSLGLLLYFYHGFSQGIAQKYVCQCWVKVNTLDRLQWKTPQQSTNADQKITRNSVFDCHLTNGNHAIWQMAIKHSVSNDFLSTFVDDYSINIFDCRLSSVVKSKSQYRTTGA